MSWPQVPEILMQEPKKLKQLPKTNEPVKASELLSTVAENYGTYYELSEQLKMWQEWYRSKKLIFESVN
jgi:hypothetical protein